MVLRKKVTRLLGISLISSTIFTTTVFAAIPVIDTKNIEEAIRTYVVNNEILTNEQKQLALQVLNTKKLDTQNLLGYLSKVHEHDKKQWNIPGILNKDSKVTQFLKQYFPHSVDALSKGGSQNPYSFAMGIYKGIEELSDGNLLQAKAVQMENQYITQLVNRGLDSVLKSSGLLQVEQGKGQIQAAQVEAQKETNKQLAAANTMQAIQMKKEATEQAEAKAKNKAVADNFKNSVPKVHKAKNLTYSEINKAYGGF